MRSKILIIFIGLFSGCASNVLDDSFWVKSVGDRMSIIHGNDLDGTIELDELKKLKNLYAIGPVAGLRGEVTIYDSQPSISTVVDGSPLVTEGYVGEAIFLMYSSAPKWQAISLENSVEGLNNIEAMVKEKAQEHGLDIDKPFPLRIEGVAEFIDYHIIFKTNNNPHNKREHRKAKRKFSIDNQQSKIVGFWVDHNRVGKLTHPGKRTHLHMLAPDNSTSGHIDAISLKKGAKLYLPKI